MDAPEKKTVPPNGGWGWAIVIAFALNGVATVPIIQGFGLIFKDTFPLLGFSATDGTVIINTNLAFGMILGLANGPLLRKFGYRRIATIGTVIYSIGVVMTAFAKSFALIVISYGIFASLGVGLTMSAFSYALNSYFTTKRGRAMGLALTITGLGPIIMPPVTSYLIHYYGFQGTMLLYGSFTLHSLIGAALLHPLKWHMKEAPDECGPTSVDQELDQKQEQSKSIDEKNINAEDEENPKKSMSDLNRQRKRKVTVSSIDHDIEVGSIYGYEIPLPRQLSETLTTPSWDRNVDACKTIGFTAISTGGLQNTSQLNNTWYNSARSINTVNLGSSMKIFEEQLIDMPIGYSSLNGKNKKGEDVQHTLENDALLQKKVAESETKLDTDYKEKSIVVRTLRRIVDFYDLDLLKDPIYVNIMMGMSIAIFAEINFSLLTPFILSDMGLTTTKIATIMSMIASVDLVFRSLAPFLGEWLRQPPRTMYLLSLILLIISRTCLLFANGLTSVMFVAVGLGAAKGIRSVYMTLVVPSHVPIERLPYASGIQMVTNGIILMSAGPVLGLIRDNTGSYIPCIIMMNSVTALTVTMWLSEMYIVRRRNLRKQRT